MREILKELKIYNDSHEKALTYGKYVQMLENPKKKSVEQGRQKKSKRKQR
nr:MAG TPA: hypothetical protein [Caudoviricetes sp.]